MGIGSSRMFASRSSKCVEYIHHQNGNKTPIPIRDSPQLAEAVDLVEAVDVVGAGDVVEAGDAVKVVW